MCVKAFILDIAQFSITRLGRAFFSSFRYAK